ncbi:MAG: hypothetical protein ACM3JH_06230 [Acidithiobacillales bacterium]
MSALPLPLPDDLSRQLVRAADLAGRAGPDRGALPTAIPPLDRLLPGGLPRGALVEVTGTRSSGRFSLALSVLAAATEAGEATALVDLGDHFDPQAAAAAGADLKRLLWVRPRTLKEALLSAETLLSAGLPLVVLDLGLATPKISLARRARHDFAFLRLARTAGAHGAALLVLSPFHVAGPAAGAVLAASAPRPGWSRPVFGSSGGRAALPLLLGLTSRLSLEKLRGRRPGAAEAVHLRMQGSIPSGSSSRASQEISSSHMRRLLVQPPIAEKHVSRQA